MVELNQFLKIERCPHCSIDRPNLSAIGNEILTASDDGKVRRMWRIYECKRCGGLIIGCRWDYTAIVHAIYPEPEKVNENLPIKVKTFLQQAIDSVHSPSGSVMLSGSAVDAMLKEKGYLDGSLNARIEKAAKDHLITASMAKCAHQVRLDANDQRHADMDAILPTFEDAKKSIEFAKAFAEYLFVLHVLTVLIDQPVEEHH